LLKSRRLGPKETFKINQINDQAVAPLLMPNTKVEIDYGFYLLGAGPSFWTEYPPDLIMIMSIIYKREIDKMIDDF
jgi:hypothetical protein